MGLKKKILGMSGNASSETNEGMLAHLGNPKTQHGLVLWDGTNVVEALYDEWRGASSEAVDEC